VRGPAAAARAPESAAEDVARFAESMRPLGEVGLVFRRVDVEAGTISDASARIRLASALGAAIELDRFDVRAAVWFADLSDLDHEIGVIASIGARIYSF